MQNGIKDDFPLIDPALLEGSNVDVNKLRLEMNLVRFTALRTYSIREAATTLPLLTLLFWQLFGWSIYMVCAETIMIFFYLVNFIEKNRKVRAVQRQIDSLETKDSESLS